MYCLSCYSDVLPCSRTSAVPWDGKGVNREAVWCGNRSVRRVPLGVNSVVLGRTGIETNIDSRKVEGTAIEGLEIAKGCIHNYSAMSRSETEMSIPAVDVVALTAGYESVL
jgi:hypothetical protein